MKYLFLIFTFLCVFRLNSYARKPAVEPILGVSIEEYKEVPPQKAKGYDFNRVPSSNVKKPQLNMNSVDTYNPLVLQKDPASIKMTTKDGSQILLYFLLTLPLLASLVAYFKMKMPVESEDSSKDNVVSFNDHKNKPDHDVKKAS